MRTTKELLSILLSEYQMITPPNPLYSHPGFGFKRVVDEAVRGNRITKEERDCLLAFLNDNKPTSALSLFYWFPSREVAPRIEYLSELISKIN